MFKWLTKKFEKKNASAYISELMRLSEASWTKKDYQSLAREGYCKNVIAFHCIKSIADAAADIPYYLKIGDEIIEKHPILDLMSRPNQMQSYKTFMREAIIQRLISGNTYILGNKVSTNRIMDLTLLRPDRVTIELNKYQELGCYVYAINGYTYRYEIDPVSYLSDVLHLKEVNPLCDLYGLSPIAAAAMGIDQHNESGEWNKSLLENSARPPGILAIKDRGDSAASIDKIAMDKLRAEFNEKYAGYRNAGQIPILSFDLEWRAMGFSPTDMDWLNSRATTARDICLAFRYPAHLLGLADGSTFNNVSEAKLSLYEGTVIPLLQDILCELSYYLSRHQLKKGIEVSKGFELVADLDQVPALSPRREITRKNARDDVTAGIITINEARAEIGYDEVDNGDEVLIPAGKLPLSFDLGNNVDTNKEPTKQQFLNWLKDEGYDENFSRKLSEIAYSNGLDKNIQH